jgi:hypothetical protein
MDYYRVHPVAGVKTLGNRKRIKEWVVDGTTGLRTKPAAEVGVPSGESGMKEKQHPSEMKRSLRKKSPQMRGRSDSP